MSKQNVHPGCTSPTERPRSMSNLQRSRDPVSRRLQIPSRAALVFAAAMSLATHASAQSAPPPSPNATLTIGIGVDLDTLDPAQQTTTTVQNVIDYGLEKL